MKIISRNINPEQIAQSGQCFRWKQNEDNSYRVIAFNKILDIKNNGSFLELSCDENDWNGIWKEYLDYNFNFEQVGKLIHDFNDKHLTESFLLGNGIRILKQDLWEVIVSFIISQNNNIARIRKTIESVCAEFHKPVPGSSNEFCFPGPFDISPDFFLKDFGLGYRNEYLYRITDYVQNNPNYLNELSAMNYNEAFDSLINHKGIGPKVANCICLFGLHHIGAFPVDTHVKSLINRYYNGTFDYGYFKEYAGIVQQYLFYYELKNK